MQITEPKKFWRANFSCIPSINNFKVLQLQKSNGQIDQQRHKIVKEKMAPFLNLYLLQELIWRFFQIIMIQGIAC